MGLVLSQFPCMINTQMIFGLINQVGSIVAFKANMDESLFWGRGLFDLFCVLILKENVLE